jgi:hypothetical protein
VCLQLATHICESRDRERHVRLVGTETHAGSAGNPSSLIVQPSNVNIATVVCCKVTRRCGCTTAPNASAVPRVTVTWQACTPTSRRSSEPAGTTYCSVGKCSMMQRHEVLRDGPESVNASASRRSRALHCLQHVPGAARSGLTFLHVLSLPRTSLGSLATWHRSKAVRRCGFQCSTRSSGRLHDGIHGCMNDCLGACTCLHDWSHLESGATVLCAALICMPSGTAHQCC